MKIFTTDGKLNYKNRDVLGDHIDKRTCNIVIKTAMEHIPLYMIYLNFIVFNKRKLGQFLS